MAPLKCPEITKFQKHIYIENRTFDHRLVKNNLLEKWSTADMNEYKERKDHRNLMESYVASFIIIQSSMYFIHPTPTPPNTVELHYKILNK